MDVTLCVLFSRSGKFIPRKNVHRLCTEINAEGNGVIGVSTFLAPNSMLLIGQKDTVQRLKERKGEITTERISVRLNDDKWPPLHTPIVWQRNITDRAQFLMHTIEGGFTAPTNSSVFAATGDFSYDGDNTREVVAQWIDKPQLLWEAVDATLARGVETVIHNRSETQHYSCNVWPTGCERGFTHKRTTTNAYAVKNRSVRLAVCCSAKTDESAASAQHRTCDAGRLATATRHRMNKASISKDSSHHERSDNHIPTSSHVFGH